MASLNCLARARPFTEFAWDYNLIRANGDVGKIILKEIQNCSIRRSGPAYFPFTITILCLKAKILANVKKTGYSQGIIIDWDLYRLAGDS
ncbi:hypothetical protein J1N35_011558, partial [Gossypium stocksii]